MEIFYRSMRKKVSLRKKWRTGRKREHKLAWHYFFPIFAKEEISKNYTYYIITLKKDKNL